MLPREEKAKFRLETIRKQRIPSKLNAIKLYEYHLAKAASDICSSEVFYCYLIQIIQKLLAM